MGRDIERSMAGASRAVTAGIKVAMRDAAKVARAELKKTAPLVPGPDRQFSNFPRAGRLAVRTRFYADSSELEVVPVGPWGIAERGAGPHAMKAWGRGRAQHPGTRSKQAKKAWSRGRDATLKITSERIPEIIANEVAGGFTDGR